MKSILGIEELNNTLWELHNLNKVIVLYFGATWCGPCKELKKRIEENHDEIPNLGLCYIDVDESENEELINRYKVTSLPSLVFIKILQNGDEATIEECGRVDGYDWIKFLMEYQKNC